MAPAAGTPPTPMSSANGSPNPDISPADHRAATPSQSFPSPSLPPSSPLPPPSLSSGGASLHRLGISPFAQRPPQRRADASNSSQDDARDSRDVLLQRLADLMERVSDSRLGDDAVSEMHRRVDEMEDVARTTSPRGEKKPHSHPRPNALQNEPHPNIWGTPSAILRPSLSDPAPFETTPRLPMLRPPPPHRHSVSEPIDDISLQLPALVQMRPGTREKMEAARRAEEAVRIAREAEQLNQHLATLITRLRARQEESEHIHALLIEKAEKAAQRIIVLEEQVQDLTSSLKESNTDLANLRIALKAIELQLPPPQDLDEDLRRSIQNWKADWRRRKEARASRHRVALRESSLLSSPGTPW